MNDDAVHSAASDQLQQSLQRGAVERGAEAAVVIETPVKWNPAQPHLRLDVRAAHVELDLTGKVIIVLI